MIEHPPPGVQGPAKPFVFTHLDGPHLTPLEHSRVRPEYRKQLKEALWEFLAWCSTHSHSSVLPPHNVQHLNQILCEYLQCLWDASAAPNIGTLTVIAIQTEYPQVRGMLQRPWQAMRAWQLALPISHRIPMPLSLLRFLSVQSFSWGVKAASLSHLLIPFSVLLRLGFWALLRPTELCTLTRADISFAGEAEDSKHVVIVAIRAPKTRAYFGKVQFALARDSSLYVWLMWLCVGLPPKTKLWPSTSARFRMMLTQVCQRCQLESLRLTPASLRPGGTTEYFIGGTDIQRLKFMGRWASDQTLSSYVQECMARLVWADLSSTLREQVSQYNRDCAVFWAQPPPLPWTSFFSRRRQWRSLVQHKRM